MEKVKAADIKVIAALGDSLTVSSSFERWLGGFLFPQSKLHQAFSDRFYTSWIAHVVKFVHMSIKYEYFLESQTHDFGKNNNLLKYISFNLCIGIMNPPNVALSAKESKII